MGRATALELARAGVIVWSIARRGRELDELARGARPGRIEPLVADLTDGARLAEVCERIAGQGVALDLLIHAAGRYDRHDIEALGDDELRQVLHLNVEVVHDLTRRLLPSLKRARGHVIFLNSSLGVRAGRGVAAYSSSKHALRAYADALREEVNPDGVRVTTVYLGRTATPMQENVHRMERRPYRPERLVQPEDVAGLIRTIVELPPTTEVIDVALRPTLPIPAPRRGQAAP